MKWQDCYFNKERNRERGIKHEVILKSIGNWTAMPKIDMTAIGLLIFFLSMATISEQSLCANGVPCITLHNCSQMDEFTERLLVSTNDTEIFTELFCGWEGDDPTFCCVDQITWTRSRRTREAILEEAIPDPPNVTNHPNLRLFNHTICGPEVTIKVLGGNKTGVFDYPWMVLIGYDIGRGNNTQFRCGGTVISERYVLTAAHCVTSLPRGLTLKSVRVGDHDISTEKDCTKDNLGEEIQCANKFQDFSVDDIHFHPEYTRTKLQNDIALIRLNGTANFTRNNVKPICLPLGNSIRLNSKKAVATGWGATELGIGSPDLLQARLLLVTNEECKEAYKIHTPIWYKQMCAGGQNNAETCLGDSGGPLQGHGVYTDRNIRVVQYGIISYGHQPCGIAGIPGVFTRVSYYMDWILDNMTD